MRYNLKGRTGGTCARGYPCGVREVYFDARVLVCEGILDSSKDDFEDGDEVYEAIGEVLHEVADKPEIEIRSVQIYSYLSHSCNIHGMVHSSQGIYPFFYLFSENKTHRTLRFIRKQRMKRESVIFRSSIAFTVFIVILADMCFVICVQANMRQVTGIVER